MWTRLIGIVAHRCLQDDRPREELGRGVVMLYGAMINCREAFLRYKMDQSEKSFGGFVFSIDGLISTLHNLNPLLAVFDTRLAGLLQDYALGENRVAMINRPHALVRAQIKVLRSAIGEEFASLNGDTETLGEFDDALVMLTDLIRSRFEMDDLFTPNRFSTGNSATRHAFVTHRQRQLRPTPLP